MNNQIFISIFIYKCKWKQMKGYKFNLADVVNGKQFPIPNTFRSVTQKIINMCIAPSPKEEFESIFQSQVDSLGVDYIDYYLIHNI